MVVVTVSVANGEGGVCDTMGMHQGAVVLAPEKQTVQARELAR